MHHKIERMDLWAMLVVGEAMLSLMHGGGHYFDRTDDGAYINTVLGFTIMFLLMKPVNHEL